MNFINQVTVQTRGTGFLINVISINNMPGLLVSVLEMFEELGLRVLDVKASCADSLRLEAVGGEVRFDSIELNNTSYSTFQSHGCVMCRMYSYHLSSIIFCVI